MRRILIALLSLALSGCYLSRSADKPDELERTWAGATVAVPLSRYDTDLDDVRGSMRANEQAGAQASHQRYVNQGSRAFWGHTGTFDWHIRKEKRKGNRCVFCRGSGRPDSLCSCI